MPDGTTLDALTASVSELTSEGGGVIAVYIIDPPMAREPVGAAMLGNRHATRLLGCIGGSIAEIKRARRTRGPSLCLCCPRPVRKIAGVTFGVVSPGTDSPSSEMAFVVCRKCSEAGSATVTRKVTEALRDGIWPGLREIRVTHPSGGTA